MRSKILKVVKYIFLLCIAIYLLAVFIPRSYDVPHMQDRQGIQYWNLSTGSKIAYTHVPAKGEKNPFPVIYLHGGPGGFVSERNISILSPLAEEGFDIYFYDQVGGGRSGRLSDITGYT